MDKIRTMPEDEGQPAPVIAASGPAIPPAGVELKPSYKLYSLRALGVATFLGGPLAAGILLRRNYLNLGKAKSANPTLLVALASTVLLFGGLALIPDHVLEKVPNSVIPAVYTALIYQWAQRRQGVEVERHERNGGSLYSGWKVVAVGMLALLVSASVFVGTYFLKPESSQNLAYEAGWATIVANEQKSGKISELPDSATNQDYIKVIDETCLPAWQASLKALDQMEAIEGLDPAHVAQARATRAYANLQIELFTLFRKSLVEDTNAYDKQIAELQTKIGAADLSLKE